jgi:uncharacterized protein (DUF2141 family)
MPQASRARQRQFNALLLSSGLGLSASAVPSAWATAVEAGGTSNTVFTESTQPLAPSAELSRLSVTVRKLRNNTGKVAVALFNTAAAFPEQKRALQGKVTRIEKNTATVQFEGLTPGIYAVAVLHDENENNEMDFNFVGMPLEGYGFSNDAYALFGPPSFKSAAFKLNTGNSKISIGARYFSL